MRDATGKIQLNNGNWVPMQGFGTLMITDQEVCESCIYKAIKSGVRMIDTAPSYFNEEAVGKGIKRAIDDGVVTRKELFVITKLWIQDTDPERVRMAVENSLDKLKMDYIDLFLVHQPYGQYLEAWPILEEMVEEDIIKNIGVSNFSIEKIEEIMRIAKIPPVINQIEIHPYFLHRKLTDELKKYNILPMAWGSLCEGLMDIFQNPNIIEIGNKYGKSSAQVILRWHLERGIPALFKTINAEHMDDDIDIYDFNLSDEDKKIIESLDIGYSEIIDYKNPQTEKWLTGWNIYQDKGESARWKKEQLEMA